MITVRWRLARHPEDQALVDAFTCAVQHHSKSRRVETHPEPYALEAEKLLRGHLKNATKNAFGYDWRYLVAQESAEVGAQSRAPIAAAVVHRKAPDIKVPGAPDHTTQRLILAIAVRLDLRGATCTPREERLIDQALRYTVDDARQDTAGGLLLAELHVRNRRMQVVLERNGFHLFGPLGDGEYLLYALALRPAIAKNERDDADV